MRAPSLALGCAGLLMALAACGQPTGDTPLEVAAVSSEPQAATTTYWYFRSNATSWEVSDRTRLVATSDPNLLEVTFDVTQQWLVDAGDDASFIVTPELNNWGAWQHEYSILEGYQTAPLAGHLQKNETFTTFHLRYPALGRYKATLNIRENVITVMKATPPAPGEVAWIGVGGLQVDAAGRLFRYNYAPTVTLARVDPVTGQSRWSKELAQINSFDVGCVRDDGALLRNGPALELVRNDTGASRWTNDLGGALAAPDVYGWVNCRPNDDRAIFSFGSTSQSFVALRRDTGAVLWRKDFPSWAGLTAWVGDVVLVQPGTDQPGTHLKAIDLRDGTEKWSYDNSEYVAFMADEAGRALYLFIAGTVQRLNPSTGAVLWEKTYGGENPWVTVEQGVLFLRSGKTLSRLDDRNGDVLWSLTGADYVPNTIARKDGTFLLQDTNNGAQQTKVQLVKREDGRVLWTRTLNDVVTWPITDSLDRIYLRGTFTLSLLDSATGASRWTYNHPPEADQPYPGGLGYIAAADANSVYVTSYSYMSRYPPMQLTAVDANTGVRRWQFRSPGPISVNSSDAQRVFVSTAFGNSSMALLK